MCQPAVIVLHPCKIHYEVGQRGIEVRHRLVAGFGDPVAEDLDEIRLDEMSISETVNTYLDRNGIVLWKDTGDADYRLVGSV